MVKAAIVVSLLRAGSFDRSYFIDEQNFHKPGEIFVHKYSKMSYDTIA